MFQKGCDYFDSSSSSTWTAISTCVEERDRSNNRDSAHLCFIVCVENITMATMQLWCFLVCCLHCAGVSSWVFIVWCVVSVLRIITFSLLFSVVSIFIFACVCVCLGYNELYSLAMCGDFFATTGSLTPTRNGFLRMHSLPTQTLFCFCFAAPAAVLAADRLVRELCHNRTIRVNVLSCTFSQLLLYAEYNSEKASKFDSKKRKCYQARLGLNLLSW